MKLLRHAFAVVLSLTLLTMRAEAQDQFGTGVVVQDGILFVQKPFAGLGPPGIYVYERSVEGNWDVADVLRPAAGDETGEGFSQSFAAGDGILLAGGGDPAVAWGARLFVSGSDGWSEMGGLPLIEDAESAGLDPSAAFDLAALRRIMSPPPRSLAYDPGSGRAAVVAVGANGDRGNLKVFEGSPDRWDLVADIPVPEPGSNDQFGSAMALQGEWLIVGAPRPGAAGAVFVYRHVGEGTWTLSLTLSPADLGEDNRFGSVLRLSGSRLYAVAPGAPGGGVVVVYTLASDGEWSEEERITYPGESENPRFGSAIETLDNDLWIGAPGDRDGRGSVFHYVRTDTSEAWSLGGLVQGEEGYGLGVSVAASERYAAFGASRANGGRGLVAVYERDGRLSAPQWIKHHAGFEAIAHGEEVVCEDGEAEGFDCDNVNLAAFMPVAAIGGAPGERLSDLWGWTDPETGREYALVGRTHGAAIVDITNPSSPQYLGVLPANPSGTRDIKVYADHMFVTGGNAGEHGMLVFDLTRVRDLDDVPVTFEPDAVYDGISSAHNLVIDTESGFAFTVGTTGGGETCGGGLHMVDIRDPLNPTFAGCYTDTEGLIWPGRTHDAQCVRYDGPDDNYRGRQICMASNETALRVVDVTDKDSPQPISAATYPGIAYVHQGWFSEDQRYFFLDDELDELVGKAPTTRTMVWDLADLDDPVLVGEYFGPDRATDHNLYVKGDRMYQANYLSGLRVIDISDPENPTEVGYFDTTPYAGNPAGFGGGAWTAYPFFESGLVIVSSINEGLFVLRPVGQELVP